MYTKIKSTAMGYMQIFFGIFLLLVSLAIMSKHWTGIFLTFVGIFILCLVDLIKVDARKGKIFSGTGFFTIPLGSYKNLNGIESLYVSQYATSNNVSMHGVSMGGYQGNQEYAIILKTNKGNKYTLDIYYDKANAENRLSEIIDILNFSD